MFVDGTLIGLSGSTNRMYGQEAWNKGLTKFTDKRLFEAGLKVATAIKGRWESKPTEEKDKIIRRLNDAMIQVKKPTRIENKVENHLKDINIDYIKNYRIGKFLVDFYIPMSNLVIECDGDYWHANPCIYSITTLDETQLKNIDRDQRKQILLNEKKINFIRFWEKDIHSDFDGIKLKLWEKLLKK